MRKERDNRLLHKKITQWPHNIQNTQIETPYINFPSNSQISTYKKINEQKQLIKQNKTETREIFYNK